jgi:hypothetical protein
VCERTSSWKRHPRGGNFFDKPIIFVRNRLKKILKNLCENVSHIGGLRFVNPVYVYWVAGFHDIH